MKQLRDVTIVVAEVAEGDEAIYASTTILRLDWTGTVVELENLLSRSKRVVHMSRARSE